jgi:RNA polymerase sigma-70 factor (ECF subfamily)
MDTAASSANTAIPSRNEDSVSRGVASAAALAARSLPVDLARLVPDLRRRAIHLARNAALADDLVQDAVERALRFSSQYLPGTNLRAWLQQILFSVFITRCRREKREGRALRALASDPCAWTRPESFPGPEVTLRLTPGTERALHALPSGFRSVIVLVDVGQWSYREAAAELGLPVGTVMSRLHRGRKMLASKLEEARLDETSDDREAA